MKNQFVLIIALVTVLFSCSKMENAPEKNTPNLINGVLKFDNINELTNVIDSLYKLPKDQIISYKSKEGFQSLFSVRENYYACLEFAEDEVAYNKLLLAHADLLVDGSVTEFKIFNDVVYPVINRDGIVQIGDDLYKFTEEGQIVLKNGDVEKIKTLSASIKQTEDMLVFKYNKSYDSKSYCGYYHTLVNVVAAGGKRRASFYCKVVPLWNDLGNGQYGYRTYAYSHGIAEMKTIWGGWRTYNATHEMRLNYRVVLMNLTANTTTTTVTATNEYYIYYEEDVATGISYNQNDQGAYEGIFDWINVNQYLHSGMENQWLTISCEANPYGK